ncbi:Uncharacterised protein [Vibrio cholerae]|uniref:Uncharacterized protein n=1 Tax=Vibrio cholerae TaxID=666 RepID=A0A656ASD8_VIBCL|nr:Uncharacterised protein [Vibrio cholerae]CSB23122.1 Uncharacterised protein [Vibrio cholerae]CSC08158.1 Uncharacterised protein [Vibrio cholerae]CSD32024.1 Uncharacterised protein [Vibrio cholerae]
MTVCFASAFHTMSITRKATTSHALTIRTITFVLFSTLSIGLCLVGFVFRQLHITIAA